MNSMLQHTACLGDILGNQEFQMPRVRMIKVVSQLASVSAVFFRRLGTKASSPTMPTKAKVAP